MANELTNSLFEALMKQHKLPAVTAAKFVEQLFETIGEGLDSDRQVKVRGLGTFKIQTGKLGENISFTPETSMKELVNKPFSQFESVALKDGVEFEDEPTEEESVPEGPRNNEQPTEKTPEPEEESSVDEDIYEYDDEPSPLRRRSILAAVMCAIFVAGYFFGGYMHDSNSATPAPKKKVTTHSTKKESVDSAKTDTTLRKTESVAESTDAYDAMNADPRIRYGAYNIVGVERTVVLKKGETLESLSKHTLGADMIGYFQVLNNATSLSAGDNVKIPKVELRPEYRNRKK